MSDDGHQEGPSRRAVLAAGAVLAANALLGCEDTAPTESVFPEDQDADSSPDGATGRGGADGEPDAAPAVIADASPAEDPDAGERVDAAPDVGETMDADPLDEGAPIDKDAAVGPDAAEPADAATGPDPTAWIPELGESEAFPLGISSGDATPESAVIWTRYTGDTVLALLVWRARSIQGVYAADPTEAGYVHVSVDALDAGERYQYAFVEYVDEVAVSRSAIGTFRAAVPLDARTPLVFGTICCTNQRFDLEPLARAAEHTFDLFLHLGDATYADGAETPDEFREMWAQNLAGAPYRALRQRTSFLATWDDHEVGNNWNPEDTDPALIEAARDAFFEHQPLSRNPMEPNRIWRSFRWGQTAEFFVLDTRGERRPSTRGRDDAQYLSPAQFDWLLAGLRDSPAVFKIVMNSVPIGEFPYPSTRDRWIGYPAQRDALLNAIELDEIEGVVFVSGDFHHASAGRVAADGPGARVPEFLVGPGGQVPNPLHLALPALPQFDWATGVNNYARFTLDPVTHSLTVAYHSSTDRLIYEAAYAL